MIIKIFDSSAFGIGATPLRGLYPYKE